MKRLEKSVVSVLLTLSALSVMSCSIDRDKNPGSADTAGINREFIDASGNPFVPRGAYPGYNTVKALIFQPYCKSCHMNGQKSGNVSLDTYSDAFSNADGIYEAIAVTHSMPEGGPALSAAAQTFVTAWHIGGSAENDQLSGTPPVFTPPAGFDPSFWDANGNPVLPAGKYPGYNTLVATVLHNECLQCHYTGNPHIKHHFDNYPETKAAFKDIGKVIFQGKYMPPAPAAPLPANELALIGAWIEADGPLNDMTAGQVPSPLPIPMPEPIASPLPIDPAYLGPNNAIVIPAGRTPGYSSVYSILFAPHCVECHNINHDSEGVRVDTFENALLKMSDINKLAQAGTMPPAYLHAPPITKDRLAVLQAWVDAGGPETDLFGTNPTPQPSASPSPIAGSK